MLICKKCYVTGMVQGVFYRLSSQSMAKNLDVTGCATNLADGRVELLVCGEKEKVEQFCDWLWIGSSGCKVTNVQCESTSEIPPASFTTA